MIINCLKTILSTRNVRRSVRNRLLVLLTGIVITDISRCKKKKC